MSRIWTFLRRLTESRPLQANSLLSENIVFYHFRELFVQGVSKCPSRDIPEGQENQVLLNQTEGDFSKICFY